MNRIAIWGCGVYCTKVLNLFPINLNDIEVFVDQDSRKWGQVIFEKKIIAPKELEMYTVDCVVIATQSKETADRIAFELKDYNTMYIDEYCKKEIEKMSCCSRTMQSLKDINIFNEKSFLDALADFFIYWLNDTEMVDRGVHTDAVPDSIHFFNKYPEFDKAKEIFSRKNRLNNLKDYSRLISFILNINRLLEKNVPGAFAELGVYLGNNCAVMMEYCEKYERKLFMFDTFSGFDKRDMTGVDENQIMQFDDTSLENVKNYVGDNEYTRYIQGYFPDSLTEEARSENYAFVSLDCDLYAPIKEGLNFFWPRLNKGGMIFVHDYSGCFFEGCRMAVDEFVEKEKINIVLLPDKAGTAVLVK